MEAERTAKEGVKGVWGVWGERGNRGRVLPREGAVKHLLYGQVKKISLFYDKNKKENLLCSHMMADCSGGE